MESIFVDSETNKPLVVTRSNKVASKFGNFDRKPLEILDFVTAKLARESAVYAHMKFSVVLDDLAFLIFGSNSKKKPTPQQLSRVRNYIHRLCRTPLVMQGREHYLFSDYSYRHVNGSDRQEVVFELSDDLTVIRYFCEEDKGFYSCRLNILNAIENVTDYRLFSLGIGSLKGNISVTLEENMTQLNKTFRGDKEYSRPNAAVNALRNSAKRLNQNSTLKDIYYFSVKPVHDPSQSNKFLFLRIKVINLAKKRSSKISDPDLESSELAILNHDPTLKDFYKKTVNALDKGDFDYDSFNPIF